MLKNLIRFSIDNAVIILLLAGLLVGLAAYQLPRTPVDVFPELNASTVVVMTESPGLSADEVEQYVTFPIETAVNGIPGVRRVRTVSSIGLSVAYIEFEWATDIYRARQLVSERLDTLRELLPPGADAEMTPITSIAGEIMLLAVSSPNQAVSPLQLRSYAEFELRNRLLGIPGVAQVSVIGGELPEYQVHVQQEKLRLYDLALDDVIEAAEEAHASLSAGYLPDIDGLEMPIRQSGRVRDARDIAGTVIKFQEGSPVTIGQVASVAVGAAPRRGTGADEGKPAVILTVLKSPGTNTLVVTERVDRMLDEIQGTLSEDIRINRNIFRQSDFIGMSVDNVVEALRDAAIIVSVIVLLFMMNLRSTVITLIALPISLASGLLILDWMGQTLNVMTLGGLAIAVGSLVDDAIIDVENVVRRMKQETSLPVEQRRSRVGVIFDASNEIRPAMVFATIIISLVFLPLMFLEGIEGSFFKPLGIAFVVSILSSLLVALTVTPATCRLLLKISPGTSRESGLVSILKRLYEPILRHAIRTRKLVLGLAGTVTILALWLASTYGTAFLPEFNEGTFTVGLYAPPGTSLEASDRMASSVEKQLLQVDGVQSVTRRTGRAERDEHVEPVSNSEIDITIKPGYSKIQVRKRISRVLEQVPGITSNVGQPIEHRLSHILSGTPAAIAINVHGDDLDVLRTIAKRIENELKQLPGARDVAANREMLIQSLPVQFQPEELTAFGLTPAGAAEQVRNAIHGAEVAVVNDGTRRLSIMVRLDPVQRDTMEDLSRIVLRGMDGALVRLEEVAVVGPEMTSNLITRENSRRKAVISLNVDDGSNLGHLVGQVRTIVDPIVREHGYTVDYGGQFEAQRSASRTILLATGVVVLVMLVLLNMAIGSLRVSLLVLVNLPLALIGGILAILLYQSENPVLNMLGVLGIGTYTAPVISIASLVGFITLFGIAVRNGILLVNHYHNLRVMEGLDLEDAVIRGSLERLSPILMTALTAALALVPIVLRGDQPGNDLLAPLSVVILGGLLSSTLLNLVVVPAGYALIMAKDRDSD